MNNFIKNNLGYIFFAVALVVVISTIAIYLSINPTRDQSPSPVTSFSPSPSPRLDQKNTPGEPDPGRSYQKIDQQGLEFIRRGTLISNLIDKLPFEGENFSLLYNLSNNQFIAVFNNKESTLAQKEFEAFLKQNNIEDKSWLYNLTIKEISYD